MKIKPLNVVGAMLSSALLLFPIMGQASSSVTGSGSLTIDSVTHGREIYDPENPENPVDPGESEQVGENLRIDFIPDLRFGLQDISQDEATYFVYAQNFHSDTPSRGNFIQVSDFRGGAQGWTLSLQQETQFHSTEDESIELLGATLYFDNSWANSRYDSPQPTIQKEIITVNPGNSYIVADAQPGSGEGTWTISFGASSSQVPNVGNTLIATDLTDDIFNKPVFLNQAVGLIVPATANVQPANYTTVLTWTLSELP